MFIFETRVSEFVISKRAALQAGLWIRIRIGSVFNRVCGSGIRIRIQECKNDPQK
jgi:hypothetical protein